MATFTDMNGREWIINFDGPLIEKIQEALGVDIASEDASGVLSICRSGVTIVRACWLLCEEKANAAGVTAKQFGEAMAKGEQIAGAEKALRQALTDFTRPNRRAALTAVLQSQDNVTAATVAAMTDAVTDQETQKKIIDATKARMMGTLDEIVKRIQGSTPSVSDLPDTSDAAPMA